MFQKINNIGGGHGRLLPAVKSGTIDLSELLISAGNMKKSRVGWLGFGQILSL